MYRLSPTKHLDLNGNMWELFIVLMNTKRIKNSFATWCLRIFLLLSIVLIMRHVDGKILTANMFHNMPNLNVSNLLFHIFSFFFDVYFIYRNSLKDWPDPDGLHVLAFLFLAVLQPHTIKHQLRS